MSNNEWQEVLEKCIKGTKDWLAQYLMCFVFLAQFILVFLSFGFYKTYLPLKAAHFFAKHHWYKI